MIHTSFDQAPIKTWPLPRCPKFKHIMIIASETDLVEALQLELTHEGYRVSTMHDGLSGLLAVKQLVPDLVVISWLPLRLSGLEICDRLRSSRSNQPIILLTQENNVRDRVAGFQAGANDCISPPFVKEEFFARIQASLTHCTPHQGQVPILRCADLQLNRNTREAFRGDRLIQLTTKEFGLLEYMMNHYFHVLTRTQIIEHVWGCDYLGNSNIIEVYIRYLRRKLEHNQDKRLIHTVRGVGYILRELV